jgi:hypothetical protein
MPPLTRHPVPICRANVAVVTDELILHNAQEVAVARHQSI